MPVTPHYRRIWYNSPPRFVLAQNRIVEPRTYPFVYRFSFTGGTTKAPSRELFPLFLFSPLRNHDGNIILSPYDDRRLVLLPYLVQFTTPFLTLSESNPRAKEELSL